MTWLLGQIGLALLLALIAGWFLGWYLRAFRDQDAIEDLRQTMLATKDVKERELNECRRRVEELEAQRAADRGPGMTVGATGGGAQAQPVAEAEPEPEAEPIELRAVSEPETVIESEADTEVDEIEADIRTEEAVEDGGDDIGEDATLLGTSEDSLKWTLPYSEEPPHVAAAERERRREAEEALRRKTAAALSLQAELESLKEATSGKAAEIASLEDRLSAAEAAREELEAAQHRAQKMQSQLEQQRTDLEAARRQAGQRAEDITALKQEMAARDTRLNELRNRCAELETAASRMSATGSDATAVPEVDEMRRALQRQIERNRKQEAVHRAVVQQLEADKAALQSARTAPAPAAETPSPARVGHSDELSDIRGIGPGFARALREAGVETFAQIGKWNQDDIERIAAVLGTHAKRIRNDRWIEQARALANGATAAD